MNTLIVVASKYLFLVAILISAAVFLGENKQRRITILKLALLTLPIAFIVAKISSLLIYDPRPFVVQHTMPLIAHVADNGFPSDHTLLIMSLAAVFLNFNRKGGIVLFIIALVVGGARVLAGVHHPLDIIGSVGIAFFAMLISKYFLLLIKAGK